MFPKKWLTIFLPYRRPLLRFHGFTLHHKCAITSTSTKTALVKRVPNIFFRRDDDDTLWTGHCGKNIIVWGSGYTNFLIQVCIDHPSEFAKAEKSTLLKCNPWSVFFPCCASAFESEYPPRPQLTLTYWGQLTCIPHLWVRALLWMSKARLHQFGHSVEICRSVGEASGANDSNDAPRSFCPHVWQRMKCQSALRSHFSHVINEERLHIYVCVWFSRLSRMRNVKVLQNTSTW